MQYTNVANRQTDGPTDTGRRQQAKDHYA